MSLPILLDDALVRTRDGFALRLSLPWIRSLPVESLADLEVSIDGVAVADLRTRTDGEWWLVQDRLVVEGALPIAEGPRGVAVSFRLVIPYLQAGPDAPLTLPFHADRTLTAAPASRGARVASTSAGRGARSASRELQPPRDLLAGWTLAASAFNWTSEVVRADLPAVDLAVDIVREGVASVIEIEPGQMWRGFPEPTDAEVDAFRAALEAARGRVSIVGASLDDWTPSGRRRGDDERLAFLLPQLRAAHRVGATGVRLPIGQAGPPLLARLVPVLHELDLVLFEEAQGRQAPTDPDTARALDAIAALDDPHVRVLVDISMLMPALPVTYLAALDAAGLDRSLVDRLASGWRDPATVDVLVSALRTGKVPPHAHALFMDMLVRFGRADASVLRDIMPLVGAFHLKFWDLDDADGRVSQPIRDLGAELAGPGFTGTLCSEWGGHEWLDADAADMTQRHLTLAASSLVEGTGASAHHGAR